MTFNDILQYSIYDFALIKITVWNLVSAETSPAHAFIRII